MLMEGHRNTYLQKFCPAPAVPHAYQPAAEAHPVFKAGTVSQHSCPPHPIHTIYCVNKTATLKSFLCLFVVVLHVNAGCHTPQNRKRKKKL